MSKDKNKRKINPGDKRKRHVPARIMHLNAVKGAIAADNIVKAWELRKNGKTITEIAKEIGVSVPTAYDYMQRGLESARAEYTASAVDHIQVIVGQLDTLISKWRELSDCPAVEGSDRAAAIVLKALEQKSKLLGLEGKGGPLALENEAANQVIDITEALKSPATRDALKRMIAQAEAESDTGIDNDEAQPRA